MTAVLFSVQPTTPIASELRAHFDRGGSVDDAVRLVEALERVARQRKQGAVSEPCDAKRGARLPADWRPSAADVAYARARGLPDCRIATEAEKFANHWSAKTGANSTKRDWPATWRNWIINAMEKGYGRSGYAGHRPTTHSATGRAPSGSDAILAGMGRLARRIDERRAAEAPDGRQPANGGIPAPELDLEPRRTG